MVQRLRKYLTPAERFDLEIKRSRILRVLFEVMFDQENRLRALEGLSPITRAQARTALRNKYLL